ncbi:MAG: iron ABC transporter permease [Campylobacter sp.]|nr:iron ABC transporter permease [Campylobacter sp.]
MKKLILFTSILLIGLIALGLSAGSEGVNFSSLKHIFSDSFESKIIINLRLPRVLGAIFSGSLLAISGAIMQLLMKNPLASPFTLGVSQSAAFGAAFAIGVLEISQTNLSVTGCALLSSMVCMGMILLLASRSNLSSLSLVLAGIAFGALFSSLTMLIQFFANDTDAAAILFWTFGDLGRATFKNAFILGVFALVMLFIPWISHWKFDALSFGDESAKSRGLNVGRFRFCMLFLATLSSCLVVSFFGIIGFVGLIAPHLVRFITKRHDSFIIMPISMLFGSTLLLSSDIVSSVVLAPVSIPVGIITSLIGAPIVLFLLVKGVK